MNQELPIDYVPIILQMVLALAFVGVTMLATHFIGPKVKSAIKMETWECGLDSIGNARNPFSIKYFLTAILFVLFDVEVIFMYPWAVNFKDMAGSDMGMFWFVEMLVFMVFLLMGFLYVIKRKALDWE